MSDADLLDEVVARLWRVRAKLGAAVYRAAAHAALAAVGRAVMEEAERRAKPASVERKDSMVVPFPIARRRRRESGDDAQR